MNDHPAGSMMRDVGERLRNAAEIDPAKLPRLVAIAEEAADAATEALARLCVRDAELTFTGFDSGRAPEVEEGSEDADDLILPLACKRFARPSFASVPNAAVETFIQGFFGADSARDSGGRRELTDLDRALARMAVQTLVAKVQHAFQPIDAITLEVGSILSPELYADVFSTDSGRFVLFRYEFAVGESRQPMTIAMPAAYLAIHRRALAAPPKAPEPSPDEAWTQAIDQSFKQSDLKLDAVLCRKKLPLGDVARLRVGQTLVLDVGVVDLVSVECEGKPLFRSQVGFAKDSYVVRFEERIDPAQEFIDDILAD